MINRRFGFPLVAFLGLSILAFSTPASQHNDDRVAEEAIKRYLATQKSGSDDTDSQGSVIADVNGDGKSEIVLVWTLLGPTYWHNHLTILTRTNDSYKPAATFDLNGEAKLSRVKGGIIFVEQKVYRKNDPICCPTLKKLGKYRWAGKKITEVK